MGIGCASKMADSSPAKMKSEQQLGDVSSILQKLKDEVAYLQDEVEAKGAGFYVPLANQLNATRAAMEELYEMLDKEEAMRIAAEAELAALLGASGDAGSELNDLQHQIDAENQAATDLFNKANADAADMRRLAKKIRECEADVKQEKEYREEQQAKNLAIREETAATTAVRDELAAELMGVAGDVGNVHNEAQYDE